MRRLRRSLVLLGSLLVTMVACSEPSGPSIPHSQGYDLPSSPILLRGIVEMTHDGQPRLALRMSEILVVLRTNENVKAGLTAAVGAMVTVSGNFVGGGFQVLSYKIAEE